jgi:hypothetical protein
VDTSSFLRFLCAWGLSVCRCVLDLLFHFLPPPVMTDSYTPVFPASMWPRSLDLIRPTRRPDWDWFPNRAWLVFFFVFSCRSSLSWSLLTVFGPRFAQRSRSPFSRSGAGHVSIFLYCAFCSDRLGTATQPFCFSHGSQVSAVADFGTHTSSSWAEDFTWAGRPQFAFRRTGLKRFGFLGLGSLLSPIVQSPSCFSLLRFDFMVTHRCPVLHVSSLFLLLIQSSRFSLPPIEALCGSGLTVRDS